MVPARPGQAPSVRREARRGHEIRPAGQLHDARRIVRGRAVERNRDERVDRLPALARVVLADADQALARRIEARVRVAPATGRRERRHRPVGSDAHQPSRCEVGDDHQVTGRHVRPSAVLVDARPDVEPDRADVADTFAGPADQGLTTAILGPPLEPGDRVAVPARLGEPHEPLRDQLQGHGRAPAAVGRLRGRSHRPGRVNPAFGSPVIAGYVPLFQEFVYATCSAVIPSMWWPSASSLRRATSWSIASGTT